MLTWLPTHVPELLLHTSLVFVHFVAAAFAITALFAVDIRLLRVLNQPLPRHLIDDLDRVERILMLALGGLYVTGILLIAYGLSVNPDYLANEKLQAKLLVVAALSVNGFLVHAIRRRLQPGDVIAALTRGRRAVMVVAAAVSCNSWLWACYLGIARSWNFKVPLAEIATLYVLSLVLVAALIAAIMLLAMPSVSEAPRRATMQRKPRQLADPMTG